MQYDLGFFDGETDRVELVGNNPFTPELLPIFPISTKEKMVGFDDETSNQLFEELAQWNEYLENHTPYFQEPEL